MDVRLTSEQQQLRDAAAKLADDLGPGAVGELDDGDRVARLEKTVAATGWRSLRSDGATGVEVALVAEEFGRGLVDVPFLGPVLADDLGHSDATIVTRGIAPDARGLRRGVWLDGGSVTVADLGDATPGVDLTRWAAPVSGDAAVVGEVDPQRAQALALVVTAADILGAARGAFDLACDYAKVREQYGKAIGSYQAIAHMLAESLVLIEGSISILRYAAWAVDEEESGVAAEAARVAKVYCAKSAHTICETSIQVHGGIGNTWECAAHVYLRRVLVSTGLWPVSLKEISVGLS
ncbi:acyl-CoA dehydrogenase family protein [Mycolicibacterium diernhoferi]|uniref:Acyl-CoA dehydrogenase n=1 Tax=Mycolicibacterium diernhoferi TaxID=1801 RepID=A0A1Q4HAZ0_9MYCO|nr:acyl-CoA dehydrogenase family protein [Mycolicibacterium diernhoferi]OJZ64704.1 acyl-CoA dehydrogenase [Mycolicibacterium diernhoferi]OPE56070.1 acyl-CoA dehydrogenase [Mycolicibacterium diernhoferi]PEG54913.1 acyl-CoA dehydrogenase [Mycolicibacterium diernhoferi]QYL25029.1 acyl-CoA dehydrogenase [Mycolicibacterium diernhoferi]